MEAEVKTIESVWPPVIAGEPESLRIFAPGIEETGVPPRKVAPVFRQSPVINAHPPLRIYLQPVAGVVAKHLSRRGQGRGNPEVYKSGAFFLIFF